MVHVILCPTSPAEAGRISLGHKLADSSRCRFINRAVFYADACFIVSVNRKSIGHVQVCCVDSA
jgi:hypothetical protein